MILALSTKSSRKITNSLHQATVYNGYVIGTQEIAGIIIHTHDHKQHLL